MADEFDARKTRAAAWFRTLRDEIVAAFEAQEDAQAGTYRATLRRAASSSPRPAGQARTAPTRAAG